MDARYIVQSDNATEPWADPGGPGSPGDQAPGTNAPPAAPITSPRGGGGSIGGSIVGMPGLIRPGFVHIV